MLGVYFSGTGNTKYCLTTFMKEYGVSSSIKSIEDKDVLDEIEKNDTLIFAYPIYYSSLPKIAFDFIENNRGIFKNKNIFIIVTMGLFSGDGSGCAARLFMKYGAHILGGLHLKMPDCISDERMLKKSLDKNKEIVKESERKIRKAVEQTKCGNIPQDGLSFISHILGLFGQRLWFSSKTKTYSDKLKIHSDQCIGCGKCATLCPMHNLKMKHDKVVAKGNCTMCYRCVNHCPQQAITLLGRKVIEQSQIDKYL